MPLSERTYHCPCCLLSIDRDLNAALNILAVGLHSLGLSLEAPSLKTRGVVTHFTHETNPFVVYFQFRRHKKRNKAEIGQQGYDTIPAPIWGGNNKTRKVDVSSHFLR
jgi:hypothetical protein